MSLKKAIIIFVEVGPEQGGSRRLSVCASRAECLHGGCTQPAETAGRLSRTQAEPTYQVPAKNCRVISKPICVELLCRDCFKRRVLIERLKLSPHRGHQLRELI